MPRKSVYPYERIDGCQIFNENPLPDKNDFYSDLTMESILDTDYKHVKIVSEDFRITNLGEYHDLYVRSDTLLLADVSKNFRNKCIEIYELDPAYFLSAHGLTL